MPKSVDTNSIMHEVNPEVKVSDKVNQEDDINLVHDSSLLDELENVNVV